jgi:HEAT repeat protein
MMKLPKPRIRLRTLIILIAVCAVLLRIGHEIWVDHPERWLATLQSDRSEGRRAQATYNLSSIAGRLDPDLATPTLTAALKEPSPRIRVAVASLLARLSRRSESAVKALVEALKNDDEDVRVEAVTGLGSCLKTDRMKGIVIPALIEAIKDKSRQVRWRSSKSLIKWGAGEKEVPALVEILEDRSEVRTTIPGELSDRCLAALALEEIGPTARAAIPALNEATTDDDALLRVCAACALLAIGERDAAIPVLRAAGADLDPQVASVANRSLKKVKAEVVREKP